MSTDFKGLCAELADALETWQLGGAPPEDTADADLLDRARAALAQPEPEGVTDEELLRCYGLAKRDHCYEGPMDDWPKRAERAATVCGLRAVIAVDRARFARPAIEPVPAADLPPRIGHVLRLAEIIREVDGSHDKGAAALAEAILSHPGSRWGAALEPVPVSERLPGAEDCAPWPGEPDATPWAWAGKCVDDSWEWTQLSMLGMSSDIFARFIAGGGWTYWLPHHALPIPTP